MLLNNRIASIPSSPRSSICYMGDMEHLFRKGPQNSRPNFSPPSSSSVSGLQYFNIRVTHRLRRYRSMKKRWQEMATSVQKTSLSPTCQSPMLQDPTKNLSIQKAKGTSEVKPYCINEYINTTTVVKDYNDKNFIELNPLRSRIQQDLIKLRKLIKGKQRKFIDNSSHNTPISTRPLGEVTSMTTTLDDQEIHNTIVIRKESSMKKLKPLDRVKIAGCQMRPSILSKTDSVDSGVSSTSNASSTCSQYPKQQQQQQQQQKHKGHNDNKTFNIYNSRLNPLPPPLPSDSFFYRSSYSSRKKLSTSSRMSQNIPSKRLLSSRVTIPIPPIIEKKQPSFTKQETPLPSIRRSSQSDKGTTSQYTYAASTSSAIPRSMMLKRDPSLLPILLQSSSCLGIQPREVQSKTAKSDLEEEQEETNHGDDDYYYLLDYNHLISRLPKPIISIIPRRGQDEYGILFEQLDHIRKTMPDSSSYDQYARTV